MSAFMFKEQTWTYGRKKKKKFPIIPSYSFNADWGFSVV